MRKRGTLDDNPGYRDTGPRVHKLLLLNGPNLNRLGAREPTHYGRTTLSDIEARLRERAGARGAELVAFQSHSESALIERIHAAAEEGVDAALFNPAAFTHTSVALRDALLAADLRFVEVHLSNIHAREPFRRHSYFSDIALGVISGFGALGYDLALDAALAHLESPPEGN